MLICLPQAGWTLTGRCCSKYGTKTCKLGITSELLRNADHSQHVRLSKLPCWRTRTDRFENCSPSPQDYHAVQSSWVLRAILSTHWPGSGRAFLPQLFMKLNLNWIWKGSKSLSIIFQVIMTNKNIVFTEFALAFFLWWMLQSCVPLSASCLHQFSKGVCGWSASLSCGHDRGSFLEKSITFNEQLTFTEKNTLKPWPFSLIPHMKLWKTR